MAKLYFNTTAFVLEAHRKAGQTRATQSVGNPLLKPGVKPLRGVNSGIIADQAFRNIGTQRTVMRRHPVDERLIIETSMGGQFLIETRAGRDGFSAAFLKHIEQVNSRHGLDGLFLTVLSHLAHTQSPTLGYALKLWARIPSTARDGEVAYDSRTGVVCALKKSAFDSKRDPLKGQGLELPAFQQKMGALAGGQVMDISCQQWVTAAGSILGAAAGVFGGALAGGVATGAPAGVIGGAIGGGLGGASAGKDAGDAFGPIICGWGEADSPDKQETPDKGGFGDDSSVLGNKTSQDKSDQPTPTDGQPTDDGGGEDGGWPAPDAYPSPDDTGGGDPWSVVELTSFVTLKEATRLMTPVQGGGFSVKALASINTGAHALTPSLSLIQHFNLAITGKSAISNVNLKALTVDLQSHGIKAKKVILR